MIAARLVLKVSKLGRTRKYVVRSLHPHAKMEDVEQLSVRLLVIQMVHMVVVAAQLGMFCSNALLYRTVRTVFPAGRPTHTSYELVL